MTQLETDRSRQDPGGRIPPSVIEAEESLIGAMLLSQEAVSVAYENVQAEDFYRPLHGQIFSAIIALAHAGEHGEALVDRRDVADELLNEHSLAVGKQAQPSAGLASQSA